MQISGGKIMKILDLNDDVLYDFPERNNLQRADLRGANLRGADLWGADLREANLRGADLDYSCLPLWCGSFDMKVDDRFVYQLIAHICRLDISECSANVTIAVKLLESYCNKFCEYRNDVEEV